MSNVNISLAVTFWSGEGPPTSIITISNLTDSQGFFNLTINDTYDNSSYMYRPTIVKYNGTYAEYIGQSLPTFDASMFNSLGAITFYLKPAINFELSVVGNIHSGSEINYLGSYLLGTDYKTGLDIVNESNLYTGGISRITYSYINKSDCLVILNSSRARNMTFCNLNITNVVDLERYNWGQPSLGQNYSYYFVNDTRLVRCYTDVGSLSCIENISFAGYPTVNYSSVRGITIGAKEGNNAYLFVSGINSSGDHIVGKFYPNLTYVESYSITYGGAGKMSTDRGYGNVYFATNNSGVYQLYYCYLDAYEDLTCGPDSTFANFTGGEIVTGFSSFGNQLVFASGITNNMTTLTTETSSYQFMYQVKDTRLGYSVKEEWTTPLDSVLFSLPAERNYSLMIYPRNGPAFPATVDLNGLEEGDNISLGNENVTIESVGGGFYANLSNANMSLEFNQLPGHIKWNSSIGEQNFTNLTIIAYMFEGGNMVYKGSTLPANMGQWQEDHILDVFNTTTGFYNMTLPASVLGTDILLFASASVNISGTLVYYGGFRSITLTYGSSPDALNFTLYPLMGELSNITVGYETQSDASRVVTKQKEFVIQANGSAVDQAHVEVELDYSSYSGSNIQFSWMTPVGTGDSGIFRIPVFNNSIKSIQVFSSSYAPLKKKISQLELQEDIIYINLSAFENRNPDGEEINDSLIEMMIFISKDDGSCSVPYPDQSCYPFDPESDEGINPMSLVLGGGKLDFEIKKTDNNITVRYVDVDLLASGPPDAMFDEAANTSGSGLEEAWRFGSRGPEIYDYVIIGIPYNASAFNESENLIVNITKFYDEDSFDTPFWRLGVNDTDDLNGTDYEDYASETYAGYVNGSGAICNSSDGNLSSGLCYKDITQDMIWFKIPHFSGINPSISGVATSSGSDDNEEDDGDDDGGSGGGGGITSYTISEASLSNGYKMVFAEGTKASFNLASVAHSVTVDDINREENKITVTVSSVPQIATLSIGDKKKFDLNADGFYDLLIELRGIRVIVADLTLTSIYEKMPGSEAESNEAGAEEGVVTSPQVTGEVVQEEGDDDEIEANSKIGLFFGVAVALIVLGAIIAGTYLYFYNRKVKKHLKTAVF
jgi:hypothetical protein